MLKDLNSILGYIERLNQLDTANVEPMAQVARHYGVRDGLRRAARRSPMLMRAGQMVPVLCRISRSKRMTQCSSQTDGQHSSSVVAKSEIVIATGLLCLQEQGVATDPHGLKPSTLKT